MIRVLVADDEALERSALLKILGAAALPEPLQIIEAENGVEAIEAAQRTAPDIAFLDIRMPGLDGLEVARALSAFPDPPEIVMITAYDHFTYARAALRFGVREYLLKPAAASDVLGAFQKCVRAVLDAREEAERQRTAKDISDDLKVALKESIEAELGSGKIDSARLRHYVSLESPRGAWTGIALAASMRAASRAGALTSIAARAFPRAFSALARRYLAEDLGLAPERCLIFSSAGDAEPERGFQNDNSEPVATVLLIVFAGQETRDSTDAEVQELRQRTEDLARAKMATFHARCVDAHLGALGVGLSVGAPEHLGFALTAARTALDLTSSRTPLLFLRPIPPDSTLSESSAEALRSGLLSGRALSWLHENFMKSIGIETAAQALGVSPSHLSRTLKREIGLTFRETLARVRVARAKNLMAGGLSAKDASLLVGFSDQSYFTKVFLKIEGVLPSSLGTDTER